MLSPEIEISTLSISKLKETTDFEKYDIDVSIDEVENKEDLVKLKYKFGLLSNPTNIKISIDGFVTIHGNMNEISKHLQPDQKNVPAVVNNIYNDIFPLVYLIAKSMHIPSPAYRLSEISSMPPIEGAVDPEPKKVAEAAPSPEPDKKAGEADIQDESQVPEEPQLEKPVMEQVNVSSG